LVFRQISWRKGFENSRDYLYLFVFKAVSLKPLNPWTLGPLSSTNYLGDDSIFYTFKKEFICTDRIKYVNEYFYGCRRERVLFRCSEAMAGMGVQNMFARL
jgi:hypothetical protein